MDHRGGVSRRILVFTPTGRDAGLIIVTLNLAGLEAEACHAASALIRNLDAGAAAAILAEEALTPSALDGLVKWLQEQPTWSDIPLVVLTSSGRPSAVTQARAQELAVLGNVTFLERPVRPETVLSSMRAALRARLRQYEMREREETLVRVNADLEQFAYSASHDLQEPLRKVAIYSELLVSRYGEALDGDGQTFLRYLRSGALQMQTLVRDLLAYTQAASIASEDAEPVEASDALNGALSALHEAIVSSQCEIICGPLPQVKMREVHLQQVFQNLIGNAIKYRSDKSPQIYVSAVNSGTHWIFSIRDNGIGIHPDFKERIFGIFKRLHTNDEYAGTGIGLAICQRIAERYRGRIWVESEPGDGSTFYFSTPV